MLITIDNVDHPLFAEAYAALDAQFGAAYELEAREVIAARFAWNAELPRDGYALRYGMSVLRRDGALVAVCDYALAVNVALPTATTPAAATPAAPAAPAAVVHLSHLLVSPAARGAGVGTTMLDVPLGAARAWLDALDPRTADPSNHRANGPPQRSPARPIVIAAETDLPTDALSIARLRFYHRAGYRTVDPARVDYLQPDFRPPKLIDATGGPRPLPMCLLLRHADAPAARSLPADELRHILAALHHLYARSFRPADMAAARVTVAGDEAVRMLDAVPDA